MALLESLAVKHQPGQQDPLTMPGAFRGILKMQSSTLSLPGQGQAVHLGALSQGRFDQTFIIFDQNSSDAPLPGFPRVIPAGVEGGTW